MNIKLGISSLYILFQSKIRDQPMSRGSRVQTAVQGISNSKYDSQQLVSISKILQTFIIAKQKSNQKVFIQKAKAIKNIKSKAEKMFITVIKSLFSRKTKTYAQHGWNRLWENLYENRKAEEKALNDRKRKMKNSSCTLLGLIHKKLETKNLKATIKTLHSQGILKRNSENYRAKQLTNTLNSLHCRKMQFALNKIKEQKIKYYLKKMRLLGMSKIMTQKSKYFEQFAFVKLRGSKKNEGQSEGNVTPAKKSQVKGKSPVIVRETTPKRDPGDIAKEKELQNKNKSLRQEIEKLKRENEKIVKNYEKEIQVYEKEHEELKFNNELLDEANKELEGELLQRQKKYRKKMSNAVLWDHVYSNFLLFIHRNEGKTVPKEQVLECLETPLAEINVDLDAMRMENEILTELLEEYKKFYQGLQPNEQPIDDLLPFDILSNKSKFLYRAAESLISQGIGTEVEIKQLESDLDSICKHG